MWNAPQRYLPLFKKFDGVITPDFSLYRNMPLAMQIWNAYRGRALAYWLQNNGIKTVTNIRWGAATVRHNRARGVHSIDGMSNLVFSMLREGLSDEAVCNELGLDAEELLKLKHITGFSKLFEGVEYRKAWETESQLLARKKYAETRKTAEKTV